MQPAARLQTAIEILRDLSESDTPADRCVQEALRARRYAGSKDRAAISEIVFTVLRHQASFAWRMGRTPQEASARELVLAMLLSEGKSAAEAAAQFDASPYGPAAPDTRETAALAAPPAKAPPAWVAGEYPEWLEGELRRTFGGDLPAAMAAMQTRAAVDIRVNTLKTTRERLAADLAAAGFTAAPTPFAPQGLRFSGERLGGLKALATYIDGAFEFQDEAAQIAAHLCAVRPGMRVLDIAAGTGGKTLALAALMQNQGELVAADIAPKRLEQLTFRSKKAGVEIVRTQLSPEGAFDRVLVDAPCSGTGTWRRQPELRGRLNAPRLEALTAIQDDVLAKAAERTAPGGRIVYATCSVLSCENDDRVAAFLARHPGWTALAAADVWQTAGLGAPPPGMDAVFRGAPHVSGTDGFFAAILQAPA